MRPADIESASSFADKPRQSAKPWIVCKGVGNRAFHSAATCSDFSQKRASEFAQTTTLPFGYSYRALVLDSDEDHAERLITEVLHPQNLVVDHVRSPQEAIVRLQHRTHHYELVILNISANGPLWDKTLQKLRHACQRVNGQTAPLFLCVSKTQKETDFILRIERMGARFVYER
jgi:CheY-like chemotaxis protein